MESNTPNTPMESDPRYIALLDETTRNSTGHYSFKHLEDLMQKNKSFTGAWYAVREDAQRRFFEEKIQEGKTLFLKEIEEWRKAMAEQKDMFIQAKGELTATIAERDKEIIQLKKEIECHMEDMQTERSIVHERNIRCAELEVELSQSREEVKRLRSYLSFSVSFLNTDDPVTDNIKEFLDQLNAKNQ